MSADNKKVVSNENLAAFAEALAAKVPLKSDIPTKVSDLQNDLGFTDNPGTITSVTLNGTTTSSGGVDLGYLVVQEGGKGLSSNDYTSLEKSKLEGIESGAQVNTIESISVNETTITPVNKVVEITVPTKLSDLQNDSGFTSNTGTITGITMNGASKGTSGVVDLGTIVVSESDPVFSASTASSITASDISNWNSKTSNTGTLTGVSFNGTSASVSDGVASITASIPNVSEYFDEVEYDSQTKRINFKHENTIKKYIDATDFIKDGMVDDVEIATPESGTNSGVLCLVVTFNTDAGKEDIEIPLSSIFNPSNYYTKTETDSTFVKEADIDSVPTENSNNPVSSGGVYNTIAQSEYVISTSLNDLNTRVSDIEDELDNTTDLWEPGTGTGSMVSASSGGSANGIYSTVEGYLSETGGTYETNTISAGTVDQSAGSYAHAEGRATISNGGIGSHSEGNKTLASGKASHAEGNAVISSGQFSHAEGNATIASGGSSHAEGSDTIASGGSSHAEGGNTTASGSSSHAEGSGTNANASHSHAEGSDTTASGNGSHAEGQGTIASGNGSHAEGVGYNDIYTTAGADSAHAEGAGVVVKGQAAHGEGLLNVAGRTQEEAVAALADFHNLSGTTEQKVSKLIGFASHSEGSSTRALGTSSHAEGNSTQALVNATHAEGDSTTASGEAAHSEGYNTTASGNQAHAEGYHTEATANQAHAEGKYTEATSENAHAEGNHTTANGNASHTEGYYTVANNNVEHAEGQYNVSNKASTTFGNAGNTIHSVGIGTSNARKNAFEIMQNGDAYFYGVGGYNGKNYSSASTLQSVLSNIPSAVTDSTVSGWGYIKSYTETDPIFSASPAAGITASDITGWNNKVSNVQSDWNATTGLGVILNKPTIPAAVTESTVSGWGFTKNTGTLTGVKVNGSNVTVTDGIADVGTVITSHQDIKTINNQTITGTGNVTLNTLPSVSSSDNGKIPQVVSGAWALVTPASLYSGTETPSNSLGNDGDIYLQT